MSYHNEYHFLKIFIYLSYHLYLCYLSSKEINILFTNTKREYVGTCFIMSYSNLFVRRPFRTAFAEQVEERCQLYPGTCMQAKAPFLIYMSFFIFA